MAADIRLAILCELNKKPASAWNISKKIRASEQLVRYHLNNFLKASVVSKKATVFYLTKKNIFFFDGIAVMNVNDALLFWGCPHHSTCPCLNIVGKECRLIKELPKAVQDLI